MRAKRNAPLFEGEDDATPAEKRPRKGTEIVALGPDEMMALAIRQGGEGKLTDVAEVIERLTRLKVEMQDREDRKELSRALGKFRSECPPIQENRADQNSSHYADFERVMSTVLPHLRANGLSVSWNTETAGQNIKTTCIVRHENGQTESASFECPANSRAGASDQQKYGAARSYGKRYTLIDVLGLVTTEGDAALIRDQDPTLVTEEQAANLQALAEEVGADMAKFLAWLKVSSLSEVPARLFPKAIAALEQRRSK